MNQYLTYMHLLTPLHTGGSTNEGNLMGIAREVHTEFPYLPASSLRGKIRSELESQESLKDSAGVFFGQKIKDGQQPTEGEVWFADATLLFFPIASLSHHLVWITCPLWLDRWSRWIAGDSSEVQTFIQKCLTYFKQKDKSVSAILSFPTEDLYLQTAFLKSANLIYENLQPIQSQLESLTQDSSLLGALFDKLIVLPNEDCAALVEIGLQREVRVALEEDSKTVKGGSFRSEEAIPPEAVLFFPWGEKSSKSDTTIVRESLQKQLSQPTQFGGLEGLGRGWASLKTVSHQKG
jgi:CRISPR-associated protein Cmr4